MAKRSRLKLAVLALSIAAPLLAAAAPPAAVERAICSPVFQIEGQSIGAGTAFVLDLPARKPGTLLVTALHLFGPSVGLEKQVPAAEVAKKVSASGCRPMNVDQSWQVGRVLTIPGARALDDGPLKDVAAFVFEAQDGAVQPTHLKLASSAPKIGEPVWVLAQLVSGAPKTQLLHRAIVNYAKDDGLGYVFDNRSFTIRATSGAPVLNAAGEVVGINLGGGDSSGKMTGFANSLKTTRTLLMSAK